MRLRLRNTGDVVDEYRFEPVGPIAPWTTVEPQTLRLYPGTTGTVELTFAPPRTPDATAGPNPYAVRITPTEHPEAVTVPEGNLTITPFTEVRAELVPPTVKGRFRGRPRLAVDNLGNTKLTASINGNDTGDELSYDIHPSNVQIEPGRAAFVKTTLKPRRIIWFGQKEQRPYALSVLRSGVDPLPVEGTYIQRSFLPGWLATLFGLLLALTIAFVMIWIAYKPAVNTMATEQVAEAGQTLAPEPSVTPSLSAPPPSNPGTTPQPPQNQDTDGRDSEGGGKSGGGGGQEEEKQVVPATRVLLRNVNTGKCANIPYYEAAAPKDLVDQWTCDGSDQDNQLWSIKEADADAGPGGVPVFLIENVKSKMCMDLDGKEGKPKTTEVQIYHCDPSPDNNQLWWLEERASGAYWIRNLASNDLCLDVDGFPDGGPNGEDYNNGEGNKLTIYICADDDDHHWEIVDPSEL